MIDFGKFMRPSLMTLALATPLQAAHADITLQYTTASNEGRVMERVQFSIGENRLRFSITGAAVTGDYYLYNSRQQRLLYVQPGRTSYYEIRPGMLNDAAEQLESQRSNIQQLLDDTDSLDDRTRERLQSAIEAVDGASGQIEEYYDNVGAAQPRVGAARGEITLEDRTCTLYDITMVEATLEACYADPEELGVSRREADMIHAFQERLTNSTGVGNLYSLIPGQLPLMAAYGSLDQPEALVVRFQGVEEVEFGNAHFVIPDHYEEVETQAP